ncbi:peptide/nickel transport system substrate-binding protein [Rhizobiales bacterium GAS113]|nr:peptide/nickel transport system substrate-binding protein [Rhizobiales bacterium GAS113]
MPGVGSSSLKVGSSRGDLTSRDAAAHGNAVANAARPATIAETGELEEMASMRSKLPLLALLLSLAAPAARADVLNIGIAGDPGLLDPARSGNFIDRNVLASLCDKLIDTDPDQHFVPQLATSWEWSPDGLALTLHLRAGVQFQDGTPFDADAVKVNIERDRTMTTSLRKAELRPVTSTEVVDPSTVRLHLSEPAAPLLAFLADRAGMMLSPRAITQLGDDIAAHPVCAGPFSFTERVPQDRIVLDRFPGYWNAKAITIDRIVFRPMTDSSVRLVNLQTGQLQIIDQMSATDVVTVKADPHLQLAQHVAVAYRTLQFNLNHGPRAETPLGKDPRLRMALEKAIDRNAINQVVFEGLFVPNNQAEVPHSLFWNPDHPVPERDLEGAKALLRQAGVQRAAFTLELANTPIDAQIGEVIQAMAREAGFDIKLEQLEANTGNVANLAGNFDVALLTWSGRADPDANVSIWMACNGPFNFGAYCDPKMEALLKEGRESGDTDKRVAIYRKVADRYLADMPQIILFNYTWIWGLSGRVEGFVPNRDGLIRPQGLRLKPQ